MDRVLDELWIGDLDDANNVAALKTAGITTVVNITPYTDHFVVDGGSASKDFNYLQLDLLDGEEFSKEKVVRFLRFMFEARMYAQTVLIHCGAGISRSAAFVICWLMFCGFSWDQGEALVRTVRPVIQPHHNLKKSVLAFFGKDWTSIYRNA